MTSSVPATVKRVVWDVVLTIIMLVASFVILLVSALFDLFTIAFTDYCPDPCHAGDGAAVVFTIWLGSIVIVLAGTILSIVRLVRRRRAWWLALITLLIVIVASIVAFWVYVGFVGS